MVSWYVLAFGCCPFTLEAQRLVGNGVAFGGHGIKVDGIEYLGVFIMGMIV